MASATERATPHIPGTENMPTESNYHNAIERAYGYPVVKDTIDQAYSIVHANAYSGSAYDKAEQLANAILSRLQPLQNRLPLATVDSYANAGLDFVEKKFPAVKEDTGSLVGKVKKPADDAVGIAKTYAEGVQNRLSPVTEQFSLRVEQAHHAFGAFQGVLNSTIAAVPRDPQQAKETFIAAYKEFESRSGPLIAQAKELPGNLQANAQPVVQNLTESLDHIKKELFKKDTPVFERGQNVLAYTQSQVAPLLQQLVELTKAKKDDAKDGAADAANQAADKVNGSN